MLIITGVDHGFVKTNSTVLFAFTHILNFSNKKV